MQTEITSFDVIAMLNERCKDAGSIRAFAREVKLSDENVRLTMRGKRQPSPSILKALGLEKVIRYRFITEKTI
jgi:hypothetical protein